eukprot:4584881-Pleurochrysis_carterae.AAC.1
MGNILGISGISDITIENPKKTYENTVESVVYNKFMSGGYAACRADAHPSSSLTPPHWCEWEE